MATGYATSLRNALMDAINAALNAGAGPATIRIYSGSRPSTGGAETTILAELTCSDPAAPGASGGVLTFSAITADSSANNTGTATWGRMRDSTGAFVMDFSVGTSGTDLILNTASIVAGGTVSISSATITDGNP